MDAAILGDVCLFCVKMFVLLVIEHSCEETLLELHRKTEKMEDMTYGGTHRDDTELKALQDSINRLNRDLKLLYSSTFSFVNFKNHGVNVQDKRLTQLAFRILNLLSRNEITGSDREDDRAKLSLAQILRNLERRKREGKMISGIEIDTLYRMRRSQRSRIEQEKDDDANSSSNDNSNAVGRLRIEKEKSRRLFQELVPQSKLELTSQEQIQVEIGFAWVARSFVKHESLTFMIDGERKTAYSTSRAPPPKNTIFGHGNDEVLIVEFNQSVRTVSERKA